jgi:4-amino-4-deoxy-L-arabinose transferase-like glycosyltransferase
MLPSTAEFLLLLLLAVGIYGYRLGTGGLVNTEGHRVAPAWEMLDTGEFFTQRLFGQIYLRKPPGHSWAIAATTSIVGRNEWGARLVGAFAGIAMVLISYLFARRWFGPSAGLVAGLAQLLTPIFWKYQRSAEIEGLLNLLAQVTILSMLELLLHRPHRPRWQTFLFTTLAILSLTAGSVVKGPAIIPPFLATILAVAIVQRSVRVLIASSVAIVLSMSLLLAGSLFAFVAYFAHASDEPVVTEAVFGFRWSASILVGMLLLIPKAMLQALPTSLAWLAPWLTDRRTAGHSLARAVAYTSILSVLIYSAVGLTNERYTLPAFTVVSLLVGFAWSASREECLRSTNSSYHRQHWTRVTALLMLGAWVGYIGWMEPKIRATSGKSEGIKLAALLPNQSVVWGDGLIDARPETLLYAQQEAERLGKTIRVRWQPSPKKPFPQPPPGSFLLLRTDGAPSERSLLANDPSLQVVSTGKVYKYPYELLKVSHPLDLRRTEQPAQAPTRRWRR